MDKGKREELTKKQMITILTGVIVLSILISGFFVYSGIEAKSLESDYINRIDQLNSANKTLQENNDALKSNLQGESNVPKVETSEEIGLGQENSENKGADYENEFLLDEVSKIMLRNSNLNRDLLETVLLSKWRNTDEYPYNHYSITEIEEGKVISAEFLIVNLVYDGEDVQLTFKFENDYNEVNIEFVSEKRMDRNDSSLGMGNKKVLFERIDYDLSTYQVKDNTFITGVFYYTLDNKDLSKTILIDNDFFDDNLVFDVILVDNNTSEETKLQAINNIEKVNTSYWNGDGNKVLIGGDYIYDVDKDTYYYIEGYTGVYKTCLVNKSNIYIISYNANREDNTLTSYLTRYDWNGVAENSFVIGELENTFIEEYGDYSVDWLDEEQTNILYQSGDGLLSDRSCYNINTNTEEVVYFKTANYFLVNTDNELLVSMENVATVGTQSLEIKVYDTFGAFMYEGYIEGGYMRYIGQDNGELVFGKIEENNLVYFERIDLNSPRMTRTVMELYLDEQVFKGDEMTLYDIEDGILSIIQAYWYNE